MHQTSVDCPDPEPVRVRRAAALEAQMGRLLRHESLETGKEQRKATAELKKEIYHELAVLAQERKPSQGPDGRFERVATSEAVVTTLLRLLQSDSVVERCLRSSRIDLAEFGHDDDFICRVTERSYAAIERSIGLFRREASFNTFVFAIVKYQAIGELRRVRSRGQEVEIDDSDSAMTEMLRSSYLIDRNEIADAMSQLSEELVEFLRLYYFEKRTRAEILEITGMTEGQYGNRRRRALGEVRRILRGKGYGSN